ncbi:MAG: hypothetical protein E7158_02470 [Firmicutes bacterium]|nr:hypothetical protein [Bacillota bacterium]
MNSMNDFKGVITNQVVDSYKLENSKKIRTITISDLHNYTSDYKKASRLANAIKEKNPDIIFIAGDIYNGGKSWENKNKLEDLKIFLQNISEVAPVCITWGNHDIFGMNSINKYIRLKNFYDLERVRCGSVFPLFNNRVSINDMEIIGYVPSLGLMSNEGLKTQIHGVAHDKFIKEYEEYGIKFKNNPNDLTVYLGHVPHLIASSENGVGLGSLKVCDYFITGHVHDGYRALFSKFNNIKKFITGEDINSFKYDRGLVEQPTGLVDKDNKFIKGSNKILGNTNLCRGIVYFDDMSQQKIWQSSDGIFYKNMTNEINKQDWQLFSENDARKEILDNKLHSMLISEGISQLMIPIEKYATINVVDINGVNTNKRTR